MGFFGAYFGGGSGTTTVIVYPSGPTTTPVPSPYVATAPQYLNHTAAAISRLCEQFKAKAT